MSIKKIKSLKSLKKIIHYLKSRGKAIVFTNGCFDILHFGHVKYLQDAKKKGDILIVGLNSDSSVKKIKDRSRPIIKQKDRARILAALECIDYITIFKEKTPLKLIKEIKPDILIKGKDWNIKEIAGASFVKANGGKVITIALIKNRSTTNIIKRIKNAK